MWIFSPGYCLVLCNLGVAFPIVSFENWLNGHGSLIAAPVDDDVLCSVSPYPTLGLVSIERTCCTYIPEKHPLKAAQGPSVAPVSWKWVTWGKYCCIRRNAPLTFSSATKASCTMRPGLS